MTNLDVDTIQFGTTPPFDYWESDHTALVHVLWDLKRDGLIAEGADCDEMASRIRRSRWFAAAEAAAKRAELVAAADEALSRGRQRPGSTADWLLRRGDRLRRPRTDQP